MTRVDFYLLPVSENHARLSFACRLAERVFRQGLSVYLHTGGPEQTATLDELLWSFRPSSFVPHETVQEQAPQPAPVLLGHGEDPGPHHDVLINLSDDIPEFFPRFERVAEIILGDEDHRRLARQRWGYYRDRGYELDHHDMQHMGSTGGR